MADDLFDQVTLLSPDQLAKAKAGGKVKVEGAVEPQGGNQPQGGGNPPSTPTVDDQPGIDVGDGVRMLSPAELAQLRKQTSAQEGEEEEEPAGGSQQVQTPKPEGEENKGGAPEGGQQPEGGGSPDPTAAKVKQVATVLSNLGLLQVPEDAVIETEDDIRRIYQENIRNLSESQYQSWIDSLPEQSKKLVGLLDEGISEDKAIRLSEQQSFISSISDESTEENLEKAYRLRLKYQGMDQKEIEEFVQVAKDTDTLKQKGLEAKSKLETALKQEEDAEKQRIADEERAHQERMRAQQKQLEAMIEERNEILPGVKLTPQMKTKLNQSFFTPVAEHNGHPINQVTEMRLRNPAEFDLMLHYLVQTGVLNIDPKTKTLKPKMDVLNRKATTKATESLLDIATNQESPLPEGSQASGGVKSFFDVIDGK